MIGGEWKRAGGDRQSSPSSSFQDCFALPLASYRESYCCV